MGGTYRRAAEVAIDQVVRYRTASGVRAGEGGQVRAMTLGIRVPSHVDLETEIAIDSLVSPGPARVDQESVSYVSCLLSQASPLVDVRSGSVEFEVLVCDGA
jgi:hypothetical protein